MELVILILGVGLLVGLILRKREDNTMQTLSKGCGCLIVLIIILILASAFFMYYYYEANP
jgi:uncharacterized ion transporter superfamily protein YfcC